MPIAPGSRLGPYEVVCAIGAGGMGEVYRARDTKLGRDVAVKLLSNTFATDPDRRARFEREAQVLASLNHPHIAHIYGLEESDTGRALVMELVDGVTLADRIARGAIPLAEAASIARQIAEALEDRPRQGHRAPRPQARQRHADRGRRRESPRLRPCRGGTRSALVHRRCDTLSNANDRRDRRRRDPGHGRWSANGRELYYISPDRKLMAVPVKSAPGMFEPGVAVPLFELPLLAGFFPYDVAPDGRFLVNAVTDLASAMAPPLTIVLNWQAASGQ